MFGIGYSYKVNVSESLKRIGELTIGEYGEKNLREIIAIAQKVKTFVDHVIRVRAVEMHESKLTHLRDASALLRTLTQTKYDHFVGKLQMQVRDIIVALNAYASEGSLYLMRHPDKRTKVPGRSLSDKGVKEAKVIGEMIEEEILLSPKPVLLKIFTSEISRTQLLAKLILHINNAKRLELSEGHLTIDGPREHPALSMGPVSKDAYTLVEQLSKKYRDPDEAEWEITLSWMNKTDGFDKIINDGGLLDPGVVFRNLSNFIVESEREIHGTPDKYVIILGLGHSWNIDTVVYPRTKIPDMIGTTQYAKFEHHHFFYKGRWYPYQS